MSGIPKASVFCEPVNAAATLGWKDKREGQEVSSAVSVCVSAATIY